MSIRPWECPIGCPRREKDSLLDFEDHLAVPLGKADILATDYELKSDEQRNPREWKANLTSMKLFPLDADVGLAVHVQEVLPGSRRFTRQQINEAMEHSGLLTNTRREVLDRLFKDEGDQS